MILSGKDIAKYHGDRIRIEPYDPKNLGPNSYNLHLHEDLVVYDETTLDMRKANKTKSMRIPPEGMVLEPGKLYLGRTVEYTETIDFVPMIEGRSSIGRLGMCIHVTAGFGDVGFKGFWTLEIFVLQAIRVYAGVAVCQVYYHTVSPDYVPYQSSKYQANQGIQASLLYKELGGEKTP
jgi:dCTP deaminase